MHTRLSAAAVRTTGIAAATLAIMTMAACGAAAEADSSAAHATPTAPESSTVQATHLQSPAGSPSVKPSNTTRAKESPAATKKPTAVTESRIKVPNGVGLDYQAAQDLWRSAGLHVAPAIDATGAHRLPFMDSNWVVLAQNLKAGSKVPADSLITATVKKFSDD